MRILRAVLLALACLAGPVAGEEAPPGAELTLGQVRSLVLVVDLDRLFVESLFGKRVTARLNEARSALASENDRIATALMEEERGLTERRQTMPVEEFRVIAEQFDARVEAIRDAQDTKSNNLSQMLAQEQDIFIRVSRPILGEMMQLAGAAVILDRRFVLDRVDAVDVTDEAIAEIDARIGDGAALQPPEVAPAEETPVDGAPAEPAPAP
jgi:Skp family chaperone for outer membrane proteins